MLKHLRISKRLKAEYLEEKKLRDERTKYFNPDAGSLFIDYIIPSGLSLKEEEIYRRKLDIKLRKSFNAKLKSGFIW